MPEDLVIKLKLDKSQASAENKAFTAEAKKQAKELLTDAQVAEAAKLDLIKRTNRQRIDEASKATKTEIELERDAAKNKERTEKQKSDAATKAAREQVQATRAALKEQDAANSSILSGTKAIGMFAAQMVGLGSATAGLNLIVTSFEKARDIALSAVDTVVKYRESIRELAALKGQLGDTTKTTAQDLVFRLKTLQTGPESNAFQQAALGVGESNIDENGVQRLISKEEFQKLMEHAGAFQAAEGGSAETHGRLAGMMPMLMGRRTNAGEAFAEEQVLYNIFKPGGGTFTQLTNQYLENAPLVSSGLVNDRRMAALLSAFSTTNPQGAGTNLQQFARATVGGLGRMRGVEGDERQAQYLKRLGATDQMDLVEIGDLISKDFEEQEKKAAGEGKKFNALTYLRKHGYMNQEDIMSLLAYHGLRKTGQMQNKFLPLTLQQLTGEQAMAPIEEAQQTKEVMLERRVQLGTEAANIKVGAPLEYYEKLRRRAYDQLKAGGQTSSVWGTYEDYAKDWALGGETRLDKEAAKSMIAEWRKRGGAEEGKAEDFFSDPEVAKAVRKVANARTHGNPFGEGPENVTLQDVEFLLSGHGLIENDSVQWRAQKFSAFGNALRSRGGDLLPGDQQLTNAATDSLTQSSAQLGSAAADLKVVAQKLDAIANRPMGQSPPPIPVRPRAQNQ